MKLGQRLKEILKAKLEKRLTDGGIGALIIGLLTELVGVSIAPTEVDAVVTALAIIATIYGRWKERRNGS